MSVAVFAGLVVGLGVWLAWTGLRPAPEPLEVALSRIDRRILTDDVANRFAVPAEVEDRDARIGRFLLRTLPVLARAVDRVHADLRVLNRTPEEQAARVGSYVALALVLGPWFGFLFWVTGLPVPAIVPGAISLVGAAWGVVAPFVNLRSAAAARRRAFAQALSAWCDVTVMSLAAGRGVEQAMETGASAGRDWAFAEMRGALRSGYVRGEPPWVALAQLGRDLGIPDLVELGSTIAMAGEQGAAVRATVAAKAQTIRERITSDVELAAAAVTERMSLPSVLLVMGFLVFLGFPAISVMFEVTG